MHEGHSHSAAQASAGRLRLVLLLTGVFLLVEAAAGFLTDSLALIADAAHMLTDVVGVSFALVAISFATRPATSAKTYGYYRLEMLAALANGLLLVVSQSTSSSRRSLASLTHPRYRARPC